MTKGMTGRRNGGKEGNEIATVAKGDLAMTKEGWQ